MRWRPEASWKADEWIREGAKLACGAHRLSSTKKHKPYGEREGLLAERLARVLGIGGSLDKW